MHIVNVEDYFHPEAGYQLNILAKYWVSMGHRVTIISADLKQIGGAFCSFFSIENIEEADEAYTRKYGVKIIRVPVRGVFSRRVIYTSRIWKLVRELNPEVLYIHGNDTWCGMVATLKLRTLPFPLVLDSHMLNMATCNPFAKWYRLGYKWCLAPRLVKYGIPVIRTQDDDYVQRYLGIPLSQAPWISVGADTMLFHPSQENRERFRKENQIESDAFVVLYTGKLDHSKGGLLLARAFCERFETNKKIILIAVGNTSGTYGKEVERVFAESKNRVIRFGTQCYEELALFYQSADLMVFPRQCSLSFYDAQACGLPVVSEANNINIDRCSYGNGFNFKSDDVADFCRMLLHCFNMPESDFSRLGANARELVHKHYDYLSLAKSYIDVLEHQLRKFQLEQA